MNFLKIKTMTPFKKVASVLMMTVLLVSCDDFGNINDNPNDPSQVSTELLLANAQREISGVVGHVMGTIWIQYISETQYTDDQEYRNYNASFNSWYYDPLQDLETIIRLNTDEETRDGVLTSGSNANQIAAARIMKAYFYQMMTDRWGMIPYSEALQGRDNFSPSYDKQSDIYSDLINELKEAADQIELDESPVSGDILFSGDMERWAQFANSLRARAALRIADANETLAQSEFEDAVNDGLIDEDVMYPYLANADNENPWYTRFRTRTDYAISKPMADYLKELEDYRITVYANPAPDFDNNDGEVTFDEIVGMPYLEDAGELENDAISFPGSAIGAGGPDVGVQDAPLPIITVAEMHFAQAEAVERGWSVSGVAADHYLSGIEASWEQWGVYDADNFAAYIAQPDVAYGTAGWEERIGTQKWIALFPNGFEAWSEWRRLGYPELTPNPHAPTQQIPLRFTYPTSEATINGANYNAAVSEQGDDSPYTRIWWHEAAEN